MDAIFILISILLVFSIFACPPTSTPESAATPSFDPPPNSYNRDQVVSLLCATQGASIHYTTDGTEPSTSSPVFTAPITVGGDGITTKIRAIAIKDGLIDSNLAQGSFTIDYDAVAAPAFDPYPTQYNVDTAVTLSCATPGAVIRYTLDGTDPTATSPLYASPITVSGNGSTVKIKAYAYLAGMSDSGIAQGSYSIRYDAVATPEFISIQPGKYPSAQSVYLSCATPGATLRYTMDASEPSASNGTLYTGTPISVPSTTVIRAIAYKTGLSDSGILAGVFTITGIVATPAFATLTPGFHFGKLAPVTLSCATPGSVIRYTTDGTNPATNGITYTGPIDVPAGTTTVKACAFAPGWIDSGQVAGEFDLCNQVMYTASNTVATVSAYYLHSGEGNLTEVAGSPFTSAQSAMSIKVSPNGKFLYCGSGSNYQISAFSINQVDGSLTNVPGSPFSAGSTTAYSLSISPDSKWLYTANHNTNSISGYAIDQVSGALTQISGSPYPAGGTPVKMAIDRRGYLYVTNTGSSNVSGYSISSSTGGLSAIPGSPFAALPSPYGICVSPDGAHVYVGSGGSSPIIAFAINQSNGALTSNGSSGSLIAGTAFSIEMDKSGMHLYSFALNSSSLYGFVREKSRGHLSNFPVVPMSISGIQILGVKISPDGNFLFLAASSGGAVFSIDSVSGIPTQINKSPLHFPQAYEIDFLYMD
jgi:6-phosphogluconolactonase (cycloisomerase 2 family)